MKTYGKEIILDLHDCDLAFTRKNIRNYLKELCKLIDMERADLHWWDDLHTPKDEKQTESHLIGTSVVQFITTSSIVIHSLDMLRKVFINVFSCKDFDADVVEEFSKTWFNGTVANKAVIERI